MIGISFCSMILLKVEKSDFGGLSHTIRLLASGRVKSCSFGCSNAKKMMRYNLILGHGPPFSLQKANPIENGGFPNSRSSTFPVVTRTRTQGESFFSRVSSTFNVCSTPDKFRQSEVRRRWRILVFCEFQIPTFSFNS